MVKANNQSQKDPTKYISNHSLIEFDPFSPISSEQKWNPSTSSASHSIPNSPRDDRMDVPHEREEGSSQGTSLGRYPAFSFSPTCNKSSHGQAASPKATFAPPTSLPTWEKARKTALFPFANISPKSEHGGNFVDGTHQPKHRRGHSLIENKRIWKEVKEAIPLHASSITDSPPALSNDSQFTNHLLMEQKTSKKSRRFNDLFLPSLTKPRPTSLLKEEEDTAIRTCESDPSAFQLTLPPREDIFVATRTVSFLSSYRLHELVMDLSTLCGFSKKELQSFAMGDPDCCKSVSSCHRPVVEMLLYSCPDLLEVKEYQRCGDNEVLIIERQKNQFLVVFRVAEARLKKQPFALKDHHKVTIAKAYFDIAHSLSPHLFARLDELSEESPFSDYVFAGHGSGAGLALLTSYLYAYTRVSQRVAAYLTGAPKIGLEDFRMAVHSQPNLQVIRMDSQGRRGSQGFCHVGHYICLRRGSDKLWNAKAFKFASDTSSPGFRALRFQKYPSAEEYVDMLENIKSWPEDFHAEDVGEGVKGENNEKRTLA